MEEQKVNPTEFPWDSGVYSTGPTEPPKSRGGTVAFLLILVIFLCGIITVLGIMNVQLFSQLQKQGLPESDFSFIQDQEDARQNDENIQTSQDPDADGNAGPSLELSQSLPSVDNVPQEGGLSLQAIYEKNIPSVVSISAALKGGATTGTGVVLTRDGYIVTNAHVVADAHTVTVLLTDDRIFTAELVGLDTVSDLAVLRIDARDLQSAEFGDSSALRVGDAVAAIGDPLGADLRGTLTDGIISGINRDVPVDGRTMTLIQTNADLNSGNSGGPLINCYGQVIGINTMKIGTFTDRAGVQGLGFAIPSALVLEIVDQIISQGYVSGRPTLGIEGESISPFYQHYYNWPAGLYINHVEPGSPADRLGIEPGDILVSVDGVAILVQNDLNAVLFDRKVGDRVSLVYFRDGREHTAQVNLAEHKG